MIVCHDWAAGLKCLANTHIALKETFEAGIFTQFTCIKCFWSDCAESACFCVRWQTISQHFPASISDLLTTCNIHYQLLPKNLIRNGKPCVFFPLLIKYIVYDQVVPNLFVFACADNNCVFLFCPITDLVGTCNIHYQIAAKKVHQDW